jgi:hypothetical protein
MKKNFKYHVRTFWVGNALFPCKQTAFIHNTNRKSCSNFVRWNAGNLIFYSGFTFDAQWLWIMHSHCTSMLASLSETWVIPEWLHLNWRHLSKISFSCKPLLWRLLWEGGPPFSRLMCS